MFISHVRVDEADHWRLVRNGRRRFPHLTGASEALVRPVVARTGPLTLLACADLVDLRATPVLQKLALRSGSLVHVTPVLLHCILCWRRDMLLGFRKLVDKTRALFQLVDGSHLPREFVWVGLLDIHLLDTFHFLPIN